MHYLLELSCCYSEFLTCWRVFINHEMCKHNLSLLDFLDVLIEIECVYDFTWVTVDACMII